MDIKGGSWAEILPAPGQNGNINLNNRFKGVGVRGGLDSIWHLGCGFSLFGNVAVALLYGRFHVDQKENTLQSVSPFSKTSILSAKDSFRSSKAATDVILGIQYATMFCDSRYAFTVGLGWEHHAFFSQNHLWRVARVAQNPPLTAPQVSAGENTFNQSHGDLFTQGWTLNFCFQF
jgi:hypothetical protein